jgi:hypothetical protein
LVDAYIAALPGTVVSIVASDDGRRARIETGKIAPADIVHGPLRFKDSHTDLVLGFCKMGDGWVDMTPAALLELISTAQGLGSRLSSDDDVVAKGKRLLRSSSRRSTL